MTKDNMLIGLQLACTVFAVAALVFRLPETATVWIAAATVIWAVRIGAKP